MKTYLIGTIKELIKTYKTKKAWDEVVKGFEESIKHSFPTSKVMNNDLWKFYKEKYTGLMEKNFDDVEVAAIVCGYEGFVVGHLMGEGFSGDDIMNELGGGKWKDHVDKVFKT